MTGWNLPPGCTQKMIDDAFGGPDPTDLQEAVFNLCEKAGIPQGVIDQIMNLLIDAECGLAEPDPDELRERQEDSREANRIDGYDRDDLGESPDW